MNNQYKNSPKIAPSLLAADFSQMGDEIQRVIDAGADLLHIDVMDGEFVPNFGISPLMIASVRNKTDIPFDVHIMVRHPLRYINALVDAGSDMITFHIESDDKTEAVIASIKAQNIGVGLAFSPKTGSQEVIPYIPEIDLVLPMSVEPGFGGQTFIADTYSKISEIKQAINNIDNTPDISVDGGVTTETAPQAIRSGASILVAGTAIFRSENPKKVINQLRSNG